MRPFLKLLQAIFVCIAGIITIPSTKSLSFPQQQRQQPTGSNEEQANSRVPIAVEFHNANRRRRWESSPEHAYQDLLLHFQQQSLLQQQPQDNHFDWESPTLVVLNLCYRRGASLLAHPHHSNPHSYHYTKKNDSTPTKINRADWAHSVWQTMCPESMAARHVVLQIYRQQLSSPSSEATTRLLWNQILGLVSVFSNATQQPSPTPSIALLNSALAAAPTGADALRLYQQIHNNNNNNNNWTTLSNNLVLSKLERHPRTARKFLECTMIPTNMYNRKSFQIVLRSCQEDTKLIQRLQQVGVPCSSRKTSCLDHDWFSPALHPQSTFPRRPKWPEHIVQRWNDRTNITVPNTNTNTTTASHSTKHFVVATMGSLIVTAQPNRQSNTDLRLILWNTNTREKVGYMLLTTATIQSNYSWNDSTTTTTTTTSSLMGAYLDPNHRQQGLSKLFLTCWTQLCRRAQLLPQTEIIRKPLLCLVLQHSLGFVPVGDEGVDMEVYPPLNPFDDSNKIRVYSSTRCLEGIFSPWDVQREQLHLCVQRPSATLGRTIRIKGRFMLSPKIRMTGYDAQLQDVTITTATDDDDRNWNCSLTCAELRTILIGEESSQT